MSKSQDLYKKAKKMIPGGTQLLSKRPEMFLPDGWPAYYSRANGCEIWDLDGNRYFDMSYMGIGSCVLGYADLDVNKVVKEAVELGNLTTLNAPEEYELAKQMIQIHPWAQMVRYARTGGEAMAIAVRIARASTGRDKILFCGYHGWHDWYLAANLSDDAALDGHLMPGLEPSGVPRSLKGTAIPFKYNDTNEFIRLMKKYDKDVAAVVIEPIRNHYPAKGFLEAISRESALNKTVVIADEVSSGFRLCLGGAHLKLNFKVDMAVFSKALGNGFPIAAIIGKEGVMAAAQKSFISSTNWTDKLGPAAAMATIKKYRANKVEKHLSKIGMMVQEGWVANASGCGLDIEVSGIYPMGHFEFSCANPLAAKTLYTKIMLKKGFLASTAFYASLAHKEHHIDKYLKATGEAFEEIAMAIKNDCVEEMIAGPVCHAGFRRLT